MIRWLWPSSTKGLSAGSGGGLPRPSGPFSVGFTDYEWVAQSTKHTENPPLYVLARIYYPSTPTTAENGGGSGEFGGAEWQGRSYWIPSSAYYSGGFEIYSICN